MGLSERSDHSPDVAACARCGWPIDTGIRSFWLAEDGFWTRVTGLEAGANPVVYCPLCFTALGREKSITVWWEPHSDADPNPNDARRSCRNERSTSVSMVFVVTNGAEIDSAWTTEHEAQSQAATLNAPGGVALTWGVVGTRLGGPLERLQDDA